MKSLLFVPSTSKMLSKVCNLFPDAFVFDLEDSIPDNQKEDSLDILRSFLINNLNKKTGKWFVRLNKDKIKYESSNLDNLGIDGFMIPKTENIDIFNEINNINDKYIIALIETCMGFLNLKEIASSPYVDALALGAEDLTAEINCQNTFENTLLVRQQIVMAAIAFRKKVFDTPSFILNDDVSFQEDVKQSVSLGFSGKLAIHPKQIDIINNLFSVHDFDYLKKIIELFEEQGGGVLKYNNEIFEKPHINHIKRILKENQQQ